MVYIDVASVWQQLVITTAVVISLLVFFEATPKSITAISMALRPFLSVYALIFPAIIELDRFLRSRFSRTSALCAVAGWAFLALASQLFNVLLFQGSWLTSCMILCDSYASSRVSIRIATPRQPTRQPGFDYLDSGSFCASSFHGGLLIGYSLLQGLPMY
jgi:hypothetical protein